MTPLQRRVLQSYLFFRDQPMTIADLFRINRFIYLRAVLALNALGCIGPIHLWSSGSRFRGGRVCCNGPARYGILSPYSCYLAHRTRSPRLEQSRTVSEFARAVHGLMCSHRYFRHQTLVRTHNFKSRYSSKLQDKSRAPLKLNRRGVKDGTFDACTAIVQLPDSSRTAPRS